MGFNGYMDHTQTASVYQVLYPLPTLPGSSCTGLSLPSVPGGEGLVARLSPHVLDSLHLLCRVERG